MIIAFISQYSVVILLVLLGAFFVLSGIIIFLIIRYRQLGTTLAYLTRGAKAVSLEEVIMMHGTDLERAAEEITAIHKDISSIRATLQKALFQKSVVRYNPFKDLGGDQSFVVALLDGDTTGVIISSLHTRDGTRVYAKPVLHGTSPYKLSQEEERALHDALATTTSQQN